jgi:hypothetical protein
MDSEDFPPNVRKPVPDSVFAVAGAGEERHSDDSRVLFGSAAGQLFE